MFKSNKNVLLAIALLGATIGFTNCSSTPTNTAVTRTDNSNTAVVVGNKSASTPDVVKNEASSGDKIGVPECDDYIAKYEACITSKVPEAQRGMFKTSFETARKTWKDAAANPQAKPGLAAGCKQALETAKQSMSGFSCAW